MLDHVERRAFLVQPARKHPIPFAVGLEIVELDEGAGQPFGLPRRGRIAGAKADCDVLDPHRLAWLQGEIADDAVALVEQGDHCHAVGHRGHAGGIDPRRKLLDDDLVVGHRLVSSAIARGERQANRGQPDGSRHGHAWSGVQAL